MVMQEEPELASSREHTQSTATRGTILSKTWQVAEQLPHNQWYKGHMEAGRRGGGSLSKKSKSSPEEQGVQWRDEHPKCPAHV